MVIEFAFDWVTCLSNVCSPALSLDKIEARNEKISLEQFFCCKIMTERRGPPLERVGISSFQNYHCVDGFPRNSEHIEPSRALRDLLSELNKSEYCPKY